MCKEIISKIRNNKRFEKIEKVVKAMSEKYGRVVAAGGSLADCYFDMDFYDIDLFIDVNDLKPEYCKDNKDSYIANVLRDTFEGEAIDIVVINNTVKGHVSRFDQNFKKIFYDGKRIGIYKEAIKDIKNNEITLGSLNGATVFFRCIKSSEKYNMHINKDDMYIMHNYLSYMYRTRGKINLAEKYRDYKDRFHPLKEDEIDIKLAKKTKKYTRLYWNTEIKHLMSFDSFKRTALKH